MNVLTHNSDLNRLVTVVIYMIWLMFFGLWLERLFSLSVSVFVLLLLEVYICNNSSPDQPWTLDQNSPFLK